MPTSKLWYTDRSRYMRGFECRWKRLLEYHAFDGGIRGKWLSAPLATGRYTHLVLEKLLKKLKAEPGVTIDVGVVNRELVKTLSDYRDEVENSRGILGEESLDQQLDLVVGMSHGYARSVVPFIQDHFLVHEVEKEYSFRVPMPDLSLSPIIWMLRPDFTASPLAKSAVVYSGAASAGSLSTHDFKTTSYWKEDEGPKKWANSVQMMANSYGVAAATGLHVDSYYMHMLVKGNKRYPNLLTHAFYKPGNPPFNKEEWIANYTRAKAFSRVRVADFRSLPEWIWEADPKAVAEKFPLVGPYSIYPYIVESFFRGVTSEELWWKEKMRPLAGADWDTDWKKMSFQNDLDATFPRTYACVDFSGYKCQFYDLCHKNENWQEPKANFEPRVPHHVQEGKDDVVLNEVPKGGKE